MLVTIKKYSTSFLLSICLLCADIPFAFSVGQIPELGDPYSETLPLKQEDIIGIGTYRRLQKFGYINNDPLVISYINYLGNKLSRGIMDTKRRYQFFVVQSDQINAFAVPGGYIGLNIGLIILSENEAQLAGVVAHEIAHIKLRHSAEMIANASMSNIPMWIGIIAGIFAGNPKASMAAIKAGIGLSSQMNVNLIRTNEIEADDYGVEIMHKANYDLSEMANFFDKMENSTGEISRSLEYLSTHPMYENRIAGIQNRSSVQINPMKNSTDDYIYIKNILSVSIVKDINKNIRSITSKDKYSQHKLALLYYKRSDYKNAYDVISPIYKTNPNNLYISLVYVNVLVGQGKVDKALETLNKLKNIYPLNTVISLSIAEILVENNLNLDYAERLLEPLESYYNLNPNYLRLSSKLHTLKDNKFKAAISRSNYYELLGDTGLALEVLSNSIRSNKMTMDQKKILKAKKLGIICGNPRPLEPLFGEKTCN
ncbi:M48 family metalloprotease [Gammaproteobacteria bacterium]|nr:M48 family metalloprotease [Gammaproteobacteria bacterium]